MSPEPSPTSAIVQHPRAAELVARTKLRRKVEAAVDRLLAILNDLDGDPEAEPWLGSPELPATCMALLPTREGWRAVPLTWARGANDDRESDAGDEPEREDEHGDMADLEPSLGAPENIHDQGRWAAGNQRDAEQDEQPCAP